MTLWVKTSVHPPELLKRVSWFLININDAASEADVIVDFTAPESTLLNAEHAAKNNKSIVIGTTGFSAGQKTALNKFLELVPSVISPNMSIGVNLLFELSKNVSKIVGDDFDVEIIEAHHRNKVDSPSGTALGLAESVADGLGVNLDDNAVYERHGNIGKRNDKEIGIQTIRGGDVVGDHTVMFLGDGERIELTHKALSRDNFSRGVLRAVKWLPGQKTGHLYHERCTGTLILIFTCYLIFRNYNVWTLN